MSRLILFSGGVESTALLTRANRFDHILTVVDESSEEMMTTFRKDSVEAILKHFNLRGHYMTISSSKKFEPKNNSPYEYHQIKIIIPVASMWVTKHNKQWETEKQSEPEITEVWYGLNREDKDTLVKKKTKQFYDQYIKSWEILHPNVKFLIPFQNMSKAQQWEMIPFAIRHLVHSCRRVKPGIRYCGECFKCLERKNMFGRYG